MARLQQNADRITNIPNQTVHHIHSAILSPDNVAPLTPFFASGIPCRPDCGTTLFDSGQSEAEV
jgi:hypothetical protein